MRKQKFIIAVLAFLLSVLLACPYLTQIVNANNNIVDKNGQSIWQEMLENSQWILDHPPTTSITPIPSPTTLPHWLAYF